jgi:hypothetical protein
VLGWGQGGEMNQALYAHIKNKRKMKKKKKNKVQGWAQSQKFTCIFKKCVTF